MKNLVLIGGWSTDKSTYERFFQQTPEGWKVYFISPHTLLKRGDLAETNERISEFILDHSLSDYCLVGHSLGGALAINFASADRKGLKKLFLIDSEGIYGQEKFMEAAKTHLGSELSWEREVVKRNLKTLLRILSHPINHIKLARSAVYIDVSSIATRIRVPTLLLWGDQDTSTPLWQGEKLRQLVPNSKLIVLENKGHNWLLDDSTPLWEALKS